MTTKCEECGESVDHQPFEYEGRAYYHTKCWYGKAVREYRDLLDMYSVNREKKEEDVDICV